MYETPLTEVKGINAKSAQSLGEKLDLHTVGDILYYLPRTYKDFSVITPCVGLEPGEACSLLCVESEPRVYYPKRRLSIVNATGHDETGRVRMVWYNQPYMKNNILPGKVYLVYGKVTLDGRRPVFTNPSLEPMDEMAEGAANPRGMLAIYPLSAGITQKTVRTAVQVCLKMVQDQIVETLEEPIREQYHLCELNYAIQQIHCPDNSDTLEIARRRLSYEQVIRFLMAVELMAHYRKKSKGISFCTDSLVDQFTELLPFALTEAQQTVIQDICMDMRADVPMNRLVQGDVGSGKTVPALFLLYAAVRNGYQGAMMVPTEVLARQHYKTAREIFPQEYGIELLVGGATAKERQEIYGRLERGVSQIAIGTQALIQEGVKFHRLGAVVADEQHRFGVRQRAMLTKDTQAEVMIMSATPIPRTLSLLIYGELDISTLKGMPPGRKPVQTRLVPYAKRADMYEFIHKRVKLGEQGYVVCPLVEQSEQIESADAESIYKELSAGIFHDARVVLLHGRMNSAEKNKALEQFRTGKAQIMITTTVIEVGVDVPNASIIVIEGADRFGLAQLHQLRGRVGRGDRQSWCFVLGDKKQADEDSASTKRLEILCHSNDGFEIAQQDLQLRGPGEFLGSRQSGAGDLKLLRAIQDVSVLKDAQDIVRSIAQTPPSHERHELWQQVKREYRDRIRKIAFN